VVGGELDACPAKVDSALGVVNPGDAFDWYVRCWNSELFVMESVSVRSKLTYMESLEGEEERTEQTHLFTPPSKSRNDLSLHAQWKWRLRTGIGAYDRGSGAVGSHCASLVFP
jgi:hypothetical protein